MLRDSSNGSSSERNFFNSATRRLSPCPDASTRSNGVCAGLWEYKESCVLNCGSKTFFVLLPQIKNSRSEPGSHPQGRSAAEEARSALTPRASVG